MSDFSRPAEELFEEARSYADSKADEVKLQVAKGLSVTLSKLVSLLIIVFLGFTLLMVLSFGLILLLGELVKSYALAALGVALVLGIVFLILFLNRERLLRNTFVPMFTNLFFPEEDEDSTEPAKDDFDGEEIPGD